MGVKGALRLSAVLVLGLLATACPGGDDGTTPEPTGTGTGGDVGPIGETGNLLAEVIDRDSLRCGVNETVPGFGFKDEEGARSGFDIDFCRVVAAAVLGDPEKVEYVPLTADQRFVALGSGEIDVLIRNTTRTSSRDGREGAAFATTTFYDGQQMMVRADSGFTQIDDMADTTVCVLQGTTTELNLETRFRGADIAYTPLSFETNDEILPAFTEGRCQGWTSDGSQLAGLRSNFPAEQGGPEALTILEEVFSKEPLGPVVRDGDSKWFDAVNWAVIATLQGEEFGITSANVDDRLGGNNLDVQRFLGAPLPPPEDATEAEAEPFDPGLQLPADFAYQVIKQVGNYGEIFDRNLGPDTALGLERGLNALWSDGGLHYPPPYR